MDTKSLSALCISGEDIGDAEAVADTAPVAHLGNSVSGQGFGVGSLALLLMHESGEGDSGVGDDFLDSILMRLGGPTPECPVGMLFDRGEHFQKQGLPMCPVFGTTLLSLCACHDQCGFPWYSKQRRQNGGAHNQRALTRQREHHEPESQGLTDPNP